MAGDKRQRVYARVPDDVYAKLNDPSARRATFGKVVQEVGDWMLRTGKPLNAGLEELLNLFYSSRDAS